MGTLYRPANRLSSARSSITRQCAPWSKKADKPMISAAGRPRDAKYRSIENTLMPMAPSGTRPISTWRRESTSHSSDPMPMPIENTTSRSEATCSLPCSTSLARLGNCAQKHRTEEPHPADAQQRAEHHGVFVRQLEVAPGLRDRVPVDLQVRVCRRQRGNELGHHTPHKGHTYTGQPHMVGPNVRHGDDAGHPPHCPAKWPRTCPSPPCRCRPSARARTAPGACRRT